MNPHDKRYVLLSAMVFALVPLGCDDGPHAPALTSETVYRNDAIGLRYLAPPGWLIQARANLPTERVDRPIVLASYKRMGSEDQADFQLMIADPPTDADIQQFVVEYRVGKEVWSVRQPAEAVDVNGTAATRVFLTRLKKGKYTLYRDVTAFRRDGRLYGFIVTYSPSDTASRDAVFKALDTVTWAK